MNINILRRIQLKQKYREVFDTPTGREVLTHMAKVGNVFGPTFVAGDPHLTSFKEGQRHMALSVIRFVCRDDADLINLIEKGLQNEE